MSIETYKQARDTWQNIQDNVRPCPICGSRPICVEPILMWHVQRADERPVRDEMGRPNRTMETTRRGTP